MKRVICVIGLTLCTLNDPTLAAPSTCPDTFASFWTEFRKSIEKDRMKDIKFLSQFPVQLASADGKKIKDLGPREFQNVFYKILSEKCDVMNDKNQRQWILTNKTPPTKSSFFTCTKNWSQCKHSLGRVIAFKGMFDFSS